jgi:hypothetical protein
MKLKIRRFLAGALIATLAVIGVPQAAQAASTQYIKHASGCMWGQSGYVTLNRCGVVGAALYRFSHGTYNGHPVVSVVFDANSMCIDSLAQTSGYVRTHACNNGNYQFFEVFNGSASGTKVLKSIGAWEHQRVHICISSSSSLGARMTFATCNTAASAQQFKFA